MNEGQRQNLIGDTHAVQNDLSDAMRKLVEARMGLDESDELYKELCDVHDRIAVVRNRMDTIRATYRLTLDNREPVTPAQKQYHSSVAAHHIYVEGVCRICGHSKK
jgi:stress response protein YsnF